MRTMSAKGLADYIDQHAPWARVGGRPQSGALEVRDSAFVITLAKMLGAFSDPPVDLSDAECADWMMAKTEIIRISRLWESNPSSPYGIGDTKALRNLNPLAVIRLLLERMPELASEPDPTQVLDVLARLESLVSDVHDKVCRRLAAAGGVVRGPAPEDLKQIAADLMPLEHLLANSRGLIHFYVHACVNGYLLALRSVFSGSSLREDPVRHFLGEYRELKAAILKVREDLSSSGVQPQEGLSVEGVAMPPVPGANEVDVSMINPVEIFISHSSGNRELAESLVDLLCAACLRRRSQIRCTSLDGSDLPSGAHTSSHLRAEIGTARVFIGLVTGRSLRSSWVLFELGARWGLGKNSHAVLAGAATFGDIPGPLAEHNALDGRIRSKILKLVHEVAMELGVEAEPPHSYDAKVDAFLRCASNPEL